MLVPCFVFVGVLAIVLAPYWLIVVRPDGRERAALRARLRTSLSPSRTAGASLVREQDRLSSVPAVDAMLRRARAVTLPLRLLIEQSGLRLTVGGLLLECIGSSLVLFLLVAKITRHPLAGVGGAMIGALLPYLWIRRARARRLWKFEEQFPEAVDLLARSLRAGHAFSAGLILAGEELPAPVGSEFKLLHDRQNFGMPLADALKDFARRVPLLDAQFFVTAVLTQREAGGNLAEVLDKLSSVVRERFKVKRQVRVISAHGRITGWILAALSPVLTAVFLMISPHHIQTLVGDPLGIKMITVVGALQIVGAVAIRQIVKVEY
jgi:tight adherence protein B